MALPDFFKCFRGSPIVLAESGGDINFTFKNIANNSARQSAVVDLANGGSVWARRWSVLLRSALAAAGTDNSEIEFYWAASQDGSAFPGHADGTDSAFTTPDEYKRQLIPLGSIIVSNTASTAVQTQLCEFSPPTQYGSVVYVNKSGQTGSNNAADHTVTLEPIEETIEETV